MESILVTAIGSFAADCVIHNLKEIGCRVVGSDIYPKEWIADSCTVDEFYQMPYADSSEYIYTIKDICKNEKIKYIFPLTDVEVDILNENRHWFEDNNIAVCISSTATIALCRNKSLLEKHLSKEDYVKTIPTQMVKDAKNIPDSFPVVCKPYDGRSSQGVEYLHNDEEWQVFIDNNDITKYIVQPYIEGDICTVDVVRQRDGKKAVAIPRQELLRTLNGAGTSVYVFRDKVLEELSIKIADRLNIVGCVNFEFIKDKKNNYHFLECNPRFSGGVKFSCIAGYDCVYNHLKCFLNQEIDSLNMLHNIYVARKYTELVTSIDE